MMTGNENIQNFLNHKKEEAQKDNSFYYNIFNNDILNNNITFNHIDSSEITERGIILTYKVQKIKSYHNRLYSNLYLYFTNYILNFSSDNRKDIYNYHDMNMHDITYSSNTGYDTKISSITIESFDDFLKFDEKYNIVDITNGISIKRSHISCGIFLANGLNFNEYVYSNNNYIDILCLLKNGNVVLLKINYKDKSLICNIRYHILNKQLSNVQSSICILSTNIDRNSYFDIIDVTLINFFKDKVISGITTYNKNSSNNIKTYTIRI